MPGERSLLLGLLVLFAELPPTPAQQPPTADKGAAPTATVAPRRVPGGRWAPIVLPVPGKAGECPLGGSWLPHPTGLFCLSDHSCPGAEKCCQLGTARTCLLPATETPGYCPHTGSTDGAICGTSCHDDTACGPREKCCPRGCCPRCTPAVPAKPGFCPRKRALRRAVACRNRCADDRDCPGNRKCCFTGCGLACAPPDMGSRSGAAKPGVCPVVLRGSVGPCLELCDTDGHCPGDTKCCTTGCGHVCKPPTEGTA